MTIPILLSVLLSYLVGSIPFGYLAGLTRGIDIRTVGSGNIGATNVFRTLGRKLGILTFVLDVLKGVAAVCVIPKCTWLLLAPATVPPLYVLLLSAVAVMMGHSFPCFLSFRGGKGVATGLGIAIGLAPLTAFTALGLWIIVFALTRYVSVGSCIAAAYVVIAPWWLDNAAEPRGLVPGLLALLGVLVIVKHRSNLKRLAAGTENRFCFTKKQLAERERKNAEKEAKNV